MEPWIRLASNVHRFIPALGMDYYLMLIIGNRRYEKQIDKLNKSMSDLQHFMRSFESFHRESDLKQMKKNARQIITTSELIERAFKREKEKKKGRKKK